MHLESLKNGKFEQIGKNSLSQIFGGASDPTSNSYWNADGTGISDRKPYVLDDKGNKKYGAVELLCGSKWMTERDYWNTCNC